MVMKTTKKYFFQVTIILIIILNDKTINNFSHKDLTL